MDDFIWKYLDINSSEIENIQKIFLNNLPPFDNFFNPLELGIKSFLGLEVTHSVLICAKPNSKSTLHVDFRSDQLKLAINLPLKNCDDSITEFWESSSRPIEMTTPSGVPYINYKYKNCKKISEFKLTKPVVFNTKIPHSVRNFSSDFRLAISLRFKEDPWHLI